MFYIFQIVEPLIFYIFQIVEPLIFCQLWVAVRGAVTCVKSMQPHCLHSLHPIASLPSSHVNWQQKFNPYLATYFASTSIQYIDIHYD